MNDDVMSTAAVNPVVSEAVVEGDASSGATGKRILVIKLSALGDVVIAMGAFAAIRAAHPDAHITVLTTRLYVDLMPFSVSIYLST